MTAPNYDRVVFPHVEDGFYIVNDEGWTEAEWMAAQHVCTTCSAVFVNLTAGGLPVGGNKQRYCSVECYTAGRRRASRQWARRRAA